MCDPPDVEPDDISEANYQNSFAIGVFEDKENIEIFSTTNAADENFEVGAKTIYGGQDNEFNISGSGLLCETTYLLDRKCHEFHGSKSEKTLYSVSVLQQKALHFHYFILKLPCFLQLFCRPRMTTILFHGRLHHLFYHFYVKKTVLLIF